MVNTGFLSSEYEADGYSWLRGGYSTITESFGLTVVVECTESDYQGDTSILFKDGDRYGLVTYGWGSCGGCDALQSCNGLDDIIQLARGIESSIHWEGNATAMHEYIRTKEWGYDWRWHTAHFTDFITQAITALGGDAEVVLAQIKAREKPL